MRKRSHKSYLFLFASMLLLLSVPEPRAEQIRGLTVAALAPWWEYLASTQTSLNTTIKTDVLNKDLVDTAELQKLQLEKKLLVAEINRLRDLLKHESQVSAKMAEVASLSKNQPAIQRHNWLLQNRLKFQLKAIQARIIFRSTSSWGSSLWINVGNEDNKQLKFEAIAKNSPVIVGDSIIGVVDYVGARQSRIRLITDSGLSPSVRASRGDNLFLAKGELHGSSKPLWRSRGELLQGIGFNYDFADEEGPARDLRSGLNNDKKEMSIIALKDVLITTGMDGVFPAGFQVAEVTSIKPLQEGDYYYELEAKPTAGDLNELEFVYVIPSVGYDSDEQPPIFGQF